MIKLMLYLLADPTLKWTQLLHQKHMIIIVKLLIIIPGLTLGCTLYISHCCCSGYVASYMSKESCLFELEASQSSPPGPYLCWCMTNYLTGILIYAGICQGTFFMNTINILLWVTMAILLLEIYIILTWLTTIVLLQYVGNTSHPFIYYVRDSIANKLLKMYFPKAPDAVTTFLMILCSKNRLPAVSARN